MVVRSLDLRILDESSVITVMKGLRILDGGVITVMKLRGLSP